MSNFRFCIMGAGKTAHICDVVIGFHARERRRKLLSLRCPRGRCGACDSCVRLCRGRTVALLPGIALRTRHTIFACRLGAQPTG